MGDRESDIQTRPPAGSLVRIPCVVLVDKMHKGRLVKQWEHAVEILEVVLQQRQSFLSRGQRMEHAAHEEVTKDFGLPINPFVVVDGCQRDHGLK